MGLEHPDSVGHGHAHQKVAITYVMNLWAGDCDLELHLR